MGKKDLEEVLGAIKVIGIKIDSLEKKIDADCKISEMKSKITEQRIDQLESRLSGKIDEMPAKMKAIVEADVKNCKEAEKVKMEEVDKKILDHEMRIKVFEITFGGKNLPSYSLGTKQQSDPYR